MQREPDRRQFRDMFSELKQEDRRLAHPSSIACRWRSGSNRRRLATSAADGKQRRRSSCSDSSATVLMPRPTPRLTFVPSEPPRPSSSLPASGIEDATNPTRVQELSISNWQSPTAFLLELAADESTHSEINRRPCRREPTTPFEPLRGESETDDESDESHLCKFACLHAALFRGAPIAGTISEMPQQAAVARKRRGRDRGMPGSSHSRTWLAPWLTSWFRRGNC